jgi:chloramphenicol O-acetyltransferase type B
MIRKARLLPIRIKAPGKFTVDSDFAVGPRATILSPHLFRADVRVHIGADFFCEVDCTIGSDVLISSRVALIGNDHNIPIDKTTVFEGGRNPTASVVLQGDNLIGHGTIILGDSVIGLGSIIGAGSLVIGDVPANVIYVGRPARYLRDRRPQ